MSFNRGTIRSDVRRRLEEFNTTVFTEADFNQEFDYALQDLTSRVDFRELVVTDTTSLDTIVDQQEYTIPTTNGVVRKFIDVKIISTHFEQIDFLDRDSISIGGGGVSLGQTNQSMGAYYILGTSTIGFVPVPSTVEDVELYYYKEHDAITSDDTTLDLPNIARKALTTLITATGMKADETIPTNMINSEMAEYERYLREMREIIKEQSRSNLYQFNNY